jgi:hypothetical protein
MAASRVILYGMGLSVAFIASICALFTESYMWLIIPAVTYIISFAMNIATKYAACDNTDMVRSSKMALIPTLISFVTVGLLSVFPGMKGPVYSLIPNFDEYTLSRIGNAFYIFWFVLYGQLISGGLLQVC